MQRLSPHCLFAARAVLAWFALTLAVAWAAPLVQMSSLQAVCTSSGGIHYVAADPAQQDGDAQQAGTHQLKCLLCLTLHEPPGVAFDALRVAPSRLAHALAPVESARIEAFAGAPLPPRGPPAPAPLRLA